MSADLVHDLQRLGAELDWPETPDLAPAVVERLPARAARARRPRGRRALAIALAALLLVPAAGAVAFPGARDDVLEWLGLKSVEVEQRPELPPAQPNELGDGVTLEEAARRAGFEPIVPPRLGTPREVRERNGVVTLVYAGDLRLQQRAGALERDLLRKIVTDRRAVRTVPEGIFIEGPHVYFFLGPNGEVIEDETRAAGNTLITERGDVLLRLEGDDALTYARARRLLGG